MENTLFATRWSISEDDLDFLSFQSVAERVIN